MNLLRICELIPETIEDQNLKKVLNKESGPAESGYPGKPQHQDPEFRAKFQHMLLPRVEKWKRISYETQRNKVRFIFLTISKHSLFSIVGNFWKNYLQSKKDSIFLFYFSILIIKITQHKRKKDALMLFFLVPYFISMAIQLSVQQGSWKPENLKLNLKFQVQVRSGLTIISFKFSSLKLEEPENFKSSLKSYKPELESVALWPKFSKKCQTKEYCSYIPF